MAAVVLPGPLWCPPSPMEKIRRLRRGIAERREIEVAPAIALDRSAIGTGVANNAAGASIAITTNVTVAAGGFVVMLVSWFDAAVTLSSGSGGGLTWTVDQQQANGSDRLGVMSAPAPAGLASSTTITANFSASAAGGRAIGGCSFTGVDSAGATDGKSGNTSNIWTTATLATANANDLLISAAMSDGVNGGATATSPATLLTAWGDATANTTWALIYRIVSSTGSYSLTGAWTPTNGTAGASIIVAYKAAAAAGASWPYKPLPVMPGP